MEEKGVTLFTVQLAVYTTSKLFVEVIHTQIRIRDYCVNMSFDCEIDLS